MTDDELIELGLAECPDNDEPLDQYLGFIRWLLAHGATVDEVRDAATRGLYQLFALRDQLLYLGEATYSASEFAQRMRVSVEELNEWWRMLRLPVLAEPGARFTEADFALARTAGSTRSRWRQTTRATRCASSVPAWNASRSGCAMSGASRSKRPSTFVTGRPELPLRRAGVASGHALSRGGDFIGPVVNLAARLASVASSGDVVVDAPPPDEFSAEPIAPVVLKGYDEPITPYRLCFG